MWVLLCWTECLGGELMGVAELNCLVFLMLKYETRKYLKSPAWDEH